MSFSKYRIRCGFLPSVHQWPYPQVCTANNCWYTVFRSDWSLQDTEWQTRDAALAKHRHDCMMTCPLHSLSQEVVSHQSSLAGLHLSHPYQCWGWDPDQEYGWIHLVPSCQVSGRDSRSTLRRLSYHYSHSHFPNCSADFRTKNFSFLLPAFIR